MHFHLFINLYVNHRNTLEQFVQHIDTGYSHKPLWTFFQKLLGLSDQMAQAATLLL